MGCPSGEIGRRNGLKIHRLTAMSVRVRPRAPSKCTILDAIRIEDFFVSKILIDTINGAADEGWTQ